MSAAPVGSGWERLSAALTDLAPMVAGREDLSVVIAPGAGQGAPACLLPAQARIEIDGTHLAVDPDTADPAHVADRYRYPTAWGLLVHECAHGRHTRWEPGAAAPPAAVRAAMLLEESRIEAAQTRRRPDDRHWLRAAATDLILADLAPRVCGPTSPGPAVSAPVGSTAALPPALPPGAPSPVPLSTPTALSPPVLSPPVLSSTVLSSTAPSPTPAAPSTPAPTPANPTTAPETVSAADTSTSADARVLEAACAATLVLARADAGILDPVEVEPVAATTTAVLGEQRLAELRQIWQAAHTVPDGDAEQMIELGRRWCITIGIDPDAPAPTLIITVAGDAGDATAATATGQGEVGSVVAAVRESCARVKIMVAAHPRPADPDRAAEVATQAEHHARAQATDAARSVFDAHRRPPRRRRGPVRIGGPSWGVTATDGTRPATDAEQAAARVLGRALDTAGVRDRVATRTRSVMPPGRLADARRSRPRTPNAPPAPSRPRNRSPTPAAGRCRPRRCGWVRLRRVRVDGRLRRTGRLDRVDPRPRRPPHPGPHHHRRGDLRPLRPRRSTAPATLPAEVTEFRPPTTTSMPTPRSTPSTAPSDLARPGAARLLVIVSDGQFRPDPRREAQTRINRLLAAGCGVLWLAPAHGHVTPLRGATVATLSDPAATARAIGRAATTALRAH